MTYKKTKKKVSKTNHIKVNKLKKVKKIEDIKMRSIDDKIKKNLIFSDIHIPYQDDRAVNLTLRYGQKYKPDNVIINGDLLDFYRLSTFDQDPDRKDTVAEEIVKGRKFLYDLRKRFKNSNIVLLQGNHENRLQRYLWRNPELYGLDYLELDHMLDLKKLKIKEVKVSRDYWSKDTGHYKIGDLLIMHGDNRLNGASTSKYAGYSAKNTMFGVQNSVLIGHIHRLALVNHRSTTGNMVGVEDGCLCQIPGNANWQQGFVTFETYQGKNYNYKLHHIQDGKLIEDGKIYV